jgi:two-component system cell cycle sensor histidine kinase PleC
MADQNLQPAGADRPEIADRLLLDKLRIVARNLKPTPVLMPLMGAFVCAMFSQWVAWPYLALWYGLTLMGVVPMTAVTFAFLRREQPSTERRRWTVRFSVAALALTGAWGSMGVLLWVPDNDFNHVLLVLLLASTLAGTCVLAGVGRPVMNVGFLVYGPIIVFIPLRSAGLVYAELSILSALYVGFLFYMGRVYDAAAHDMLLLREERRSLIDRLQTALADANMARKRTEAASRAKSDFLARMSHELRTPLNAILGFSEVIRDRTFGENAAERYADYAANIHTSGRHLLSLINDVLDLSKIEAGKLELTDTAFDLVTEARDVLHFVEPQAARKNLRLSFNAPAALRIMADETSVRQIMANLLSNAVKFTPRGGAVSLRVGVQPSGAIGIEVRDTGIGIPPTDIDHVLESFGQGRHDIATTDERGTGLGLPIVKGLTEAHGGTIRIDSDVGAGTLVTIELPGRRILTDAAAALV